LGVIFFIELVPEPKANQYVAGVLVGAAAAGFRIKLILLIVLSIIFLINIYILSRIRKPVDFQDYVFG
jgi:hypothetical protein